MAYTSTAADFMLMGVTRNFAPPAASGASRRKQPRVRRLGAWRSSTRLVPAATASTAKTSPLGMIMLGVVTALLALLAAAFVATGVVVLVDNGAAEWMAAAVPAVLAVLLFVLAAKFGGALVDSATDKTHDDN